MIPLLIFFAIGTVWLRLRIVKMTYEVNQLNKLIQNAGKEKEKVKLSVAKLRSPKRLDDLSKKKFKLSAPKPQQIVRLKPEIK